MAVDVEVVQADASEQPCQHAQSASTAPLSTTFPMGKSPCIQVPPESWGPLPAASRPRDSPYAAAEVELMGIGDPFGGFGGFALPREEVRNAVRQQAAAHNRELATLRSAAPARSSWGSGKSGKT